MSHWTDILFGPKYPTAEQVAESAGRSAIEGKVIVITGATSGIGKECARVLAKNGALVYVCGRDENRCKEVVAETSSKGYFLVELTSLSSVRECAGSIQEELDSTGIDVLLCNAGIMMCPTSSTDDGYDLQMQTNHLSHHLLTYLLLPLVSKRSGRIIHVSSLAHASTRSKKLLCLGRSPSFLERTIPMVDRGARYAESKLAQIFHTQILGEQLLNAGSPVHVHCLHPGVVHSNLIRHIPLKPVVNAVSSRLWIDVQHGAATSVFCAIHPKVLESQPGLYWDRCRPKEPATIAADEDLAAKVWKWSCNAVDVPEDWTSQVLSTS